MKTGQMTRLYTGEGWLKSGTNRGVATYQVDVGPVTYTLQYRVKDGQMRLSLGGSLLYRSVQQQTGWRRWFVGIAGTDFVREEDSHVGAGWLSTGFWSGGLRYRVGRTEGTLRESAWMGTTKLESEALTVERRWHPRAGAPVATFCFGGEMEEAAVVALVGYREAHEDSHGGGAA